MKKLLILFVLMGIVTAVNAQAINGEKDIFTEQAINSISSLKSGSENLILSSVSNVDFLEITLAGVNPFQYIQQPVESISIASIAYKPSIKGEFMVEGLEDVELVLELYPENHNSSKGEVEVGCSKIEIIKS